MAINQDLMALEPGRRHDPRFLMQALLAFDERLRLNCVKSGTTVESVDAKWFRGFEIDLPELDEQRTIAAALEDMDAEIYALESRRHKARQVKQGMMQELLTGQIRLVEPNQEAVDEAPA